MKKILLMQEITNLKQIMLPAWLLLGDFNLIYRAQDNNGRMNLPSLNRFKSTIDNLLLAPIELGGETIRLVQRSTNADDDKD
jgi:hypothetical protein